MKSSLLSATSLASVTYTPSLAGRPSAVASFTMRPGAARTFAAVSVASILAASAPAGAAVIYSVNGVNIGASLAGSFTTETLYVGFGNGTFVTSPTATVGGLLIGSAVAGQTLTTKVTLANTSAAGKNVAIATGTTTLTGTGFAALTSNYGTINNGGGQTLTNTYTFVPSVTGTTRGIASSVKTSLIGNETGSQIVDTTNIVLISNWVAPVQSTTMTATSGVTGQTVSSANGLIYVLPGATGTAQVTVNNIGDGNLAADATTIKTGFGNLAGSTTSLVSATGAGGFSLASTSATISLNDKFASNIPSLAITPALSQTFTYTYQGLAARSSSNTAAATLTAKFTNGNSNNTNTSQTGTYSVVGRTVAPVQSITTTGTALYALPTQTGPSQTLTITNVGDGNLAGVNLNGTTATALGGVFTASGVSSPFGLTDSSGVAPLASSSTALTLTFTGAASRAVSATVATVTTTFTNGNSAGTNAAQTVTTTFTGQTVAPVQSVTATNTTIYALPGTASATKGTFNIQNVGDGSHVGATLQGALSTTGANFAGSVTNGAFTGLADGKTGPTATTLTQTLTYTGGVTRGTSTVATVTASFTNGNSSGNNTAQSVTQTFTGVTVAPIASTTATATGGTQYLLVGSGSTATSTLTIANTGDGTLAGAKLSGTLANTLGTGFTASTAAGALSLGDTATPSGLTSLTQTLTYTAESTRTGLVRTGSTVATFSNGRADGTNLAAASASATLSAQSVAPLASVTATLDAGVLRVGNSAAVALTVQNTGDGNLAGKTSAFNLTGKVGASAGVFTGAGGALNGTTGLNDSASATYNFVYAPTARTTNTSNVTSTFNNGTNTSNAAGSINTELKGQGVGPVYSGSVKAVPAGVGNGTNAGTVYGGTILFGDFVGGLTIQDLLISNISTDNAAQNLTDLSLTSVSILGSSEFSFSLSGFATSTATAYPTVRNLAHGGSAGDINIQFVDKASTGYAQLRVQTDEGASLGGAGTIYVYDLRWTVPEPGTLMVFGVGMLGLAISRRNRRGKAEVVALTAKGADETKI